MQVFHYHLLLETKSTRMNMTFNNQIFKSKILEFKSFNLMGFRYFLDSELKKNRAEFCQCMIVILEKAGI